jgi:hypothetical protein
LTSNTSIRTLFILVNDSRTTWNTVLNVFQGEIKL